MLDWAVEGFVREAKALAAALKAGDASEVDCLLAAFSRWTGDHVTLLHDAPHGAGILEMGIESISRADANPETEFERDVACFLIDRGICRTHREAADNTFLLLTSAKGLMLKSRTAEEIRAGMARIIGAAV